MDVKIGGAIIGTVFGVVLFWLGVGEAFAVLALALVGWFFGKLASGEIDIMGYLEAISRRKGSK